MGTPLAARRTTVSQNVFFAAGAALLDQILEHAIAENLFRLRVFHSCDRFHPRGA